MVNTPRIVPKGMMIHSIQAITRQNNLFLNCDSLRPAIKMKVDRVHPQRIKTAERRTNSHAKRAGGDSPGPSPSNAPESMAMPRAICIKGRHEKRAVIPATT
jgi:hypothetical protein